MRAFHRPTPLAWICILGIAAFAALAVTAIAVDQAAAAGSGGISPDDEEGQDDLPEGPAGGTEGSDEGRYDRLWERASHHDKRWANTTAMCESGKDPDAIGGGGRYRGAFQFLKSTWRRAPKSPGGDPIDYRYRTQAVVAIALKKREGTRHWPNCG
jgi:hypothetical protein